MAPPSYRNCNPAIESGPSLSPIDQTLRRHAAMLDARRFLPTSLHWKYQPLPCRDFF
jgi:hypothetical protein